jgi:hypothetical protein
MESKPKFADVSRHRTDYAARCCQGHALLNC